MNSFFGEKSGAEKTLLIATGIAYIVMTAYYLNKLYKENKELKQTNMQLSIANANLQR